MRESVFFKRDNLFVLCAICSFSTFCLQNQSGYVYSVQPVLGASVFSNWYYQGSANICTDVLNLSTHSCRLSVSAVGLDFCSWSLLSCFLYFTCMYFSNPSRVFLVPDAKGKVVHNFDPIFYSYVHVVCLFWQRFAHSHPQKDYFIYRANGWTLFFFINYIYSFFPLIMQSQLYPLQSQEYVSLHYISKLSGVLVFLCCWFVT